uniref:RING-CH-type domain-containing protein n=2 Tax=Brassica campestris TaxID=3711 RepID=M4E2G6_BRACM
MREDGVGCSNGSAHAVHEEVANNVTAVSCHESDASEKAKEKEFHVVDLSGGGEESDNGQRICRICHFGSDQTPDRVSGKSVSVDLIEIGCKCKNELGLAHFHCAEAWFKLRGNSVCEICGSSALNVPVRLTEEEWSEIRDGTTDEGRRRGSGQSCCIFMVFLLTIILLHWFFKKMSGYYQNT